jgi:UDP-N-acetylglucosamine 4,6-dehydratase/5-epimerase
MTRFWLSLEQGVRFVMSCIEQMEGGEVFVPKIPSTKGVDLAKAIVPNAKINIIGIRPGEKLHEDLISDDEARHTIELERMYVIQPAEAIWFGYSWKDKGKRSLRASSLLERYKLRMAGYQRHQGICCAVRGIVCRERLEG